MKRTDPTMVARATTYSGKVARIVHVVSAEGLAEYAEHWKSTRIILRKLITGVHADQSQQIKNKTGTMITSSTINVS